MLQYYWKRLCSRFRNESSWKKDARVFSRLSDPLSYGRMYTIYEFLRNIMKLNAEYHNV